MEYQIVEEGSTIELTEQVQKLLNQGWQPVGGATQINSTRGYRFIQAMTRSEIKVGFKGEIQEKAQHSIVKGHTVIT